MNEHIMLGLFLGIIFITQLIIISSIGKVAMHMLSRFNEMFLLVGGIKSLDDLIGDIRPSSEEPVLFEDMGSK